jgi:hypothetical protein
MAERSIFAPGGDGMTRGGLDRYLASPAGAGSSLPSSIEDAADEHAEPSHPVDCEGADKDAAVCQIARAEQDLAERK